MAWLRKRHATKERPSVIAMLRSLGRALGPSKVVWIERIVLIVLRRAERIAVGE